MVPRRNFLFALIVLLGAVLLLAPAIYNGYPLVNADDGTYIASGFKPETPFDRPITYGLLLRAFSFNGLSFWIAVFIQAILFSFLIVKLIQRICRDDKKLFLYSLLSFLVLSFTSASWTVSEIIPDIWTGMALLSLALLVLGKESRPTQVFLYILYTVAVATHMSNIAIFTGILLLLFLFRRRFFLPADLKRLNKTLLVTLLLTWATFATMGAAYAKSKQVFIMASLLEKGILKKYLEEYCPQKHYGICQYQDELPDDPNVFLWDERSPVYKAGGWQATRQEYGQLTKDLFSKPDYLWLFVRQSLIASGQQLFVCHLAEGNFPFPPETDVYQQIARYVPADTMLYRRAWQHQEQNIVPLLMPFNYIHYSLFMAAVLIVAGSLLFFRKQMGSGLRLLLFLFITGYLVNVVDCATFAQVNARFSSRLMWVFPLGAALCWMKLFRKKDKQEL